MAEAPEYLHLRPEVEKAYGYTHAVRIGEDIKISGAVSMDDEGNPTAVGDLEQQMKNAYSEAKMEWFDYLEVFYNQRRRHSTLGQISPHVATEAMP